MNLYNHIRKPRNIIYNKDLEKRGGVLGACGMVAHESHVSKYGDCSMWETPSQIFPLFKILVVYYWTRKKFY